MNIYKTFNTEESIIRSQQQAKTVVFLHYQLKKKIRLRGNLIKDVPQIPLKPWLIGLTERNLQRWNNELALYSYHPSFDKVPASEHIILPECPLQLSEFHKWTSKADKVIVFQPPTWEFHEEQLNDRYPTSDSYVRIYENLARFKGLLLNHQKRLALEASGFDRDSVSIFTGKEWTDNTNISEQRLRNCLKARYKFFYMKFHPYRMLSEPEGTLNFIYNELAKEKDFEGYKMLRANNLHRIYEAGRLNNRLPQFTSRLRQLCRGNFVLPYEPIYVVKNRPKSDFDWNAIIDKQLKHWDEWEKMKSLIEKAEVY